MNKFIITEQHKKSCQNLKQSKDWEVIKELLEFYVNTLKDISTLTEDEKKEDKNIVVLARLKAYESLNNFLKTIDLLGSSIQKVEEVDKYE